MHLLINKRPDKNELKCHSIAVSSN